MDKEFITCVLCRGTGKIQVLAPNSHYYIDGVCPWCKGSCVMVSSKK